MVVVSGSQLVFSAPSAEDWYLSLRQQGFETQISPHRILFVSWSEADSSYELMPIDREKFNSLGYLDMIRARELDYLQVLNHRDDLANRSITNSREDFIRQTFKSTLTDVLVLEIVGDQRWQIYHRDANGKPERIFRGRGVDRHDTEAVHKWLIDKVGYGAVVLRRQGNYFLVAVLDQNFRQTQVLALADSANQLLIPVSQQTGAGLLQFQNAYDGVAVYQALLLRDQDQVETGSKLVLPPGEGSQ